MKLFQTDSHFYWQLWEITWGESEKKLPTASYQKSLSYHSSAVNILRFSPSGENYVLCLRWSANKQFSTIFLAMVFVFNTSQPSHWQLQFLQGEI